MTGSSSGPSGGVDVSFLDARRRTSFALQLRVVRASLKLTLGITDEQASDRLYLTCLRETDDQPMFGPTHAPTDMPPQLAACETFHVNIFSSESVLHQSQATLRATVEHGVATLSLLDRPEDIEIASRYFADFGKTDLFKAVVNCALGDDGEIMPLSVDLTLSRGLT